MKIGLFWRINGKRLSCDVHAFFSCMFAQPYCELHNNRPNFALFPIVFRGNSANYPCSEWFSIGNWAIIMQFAVLLLASLRDVCPRTHQPVSRSCLPIPTHSTIRKRTFLSFSYVCPEPVLVKWSFLNIKMAQKRRFLTCGVSTEQS